jgi:hypothetical protein
VNCDWHAFVYLLSLSYMISGQMTRWSLLSSFWLFWLPHWLIYLAIRFARKKPRHHLQFKYRIFNTCHFQLTNLYTWHRRRLFSRMAIFDSGHLLRLNQCRSFSFCSSSFQNSLKLISHIILETKQEFYKSIIEAIQSIAFTCFASGDLSNETWGNFYNVVYLELGGFVTVHFDLHSYC